MGMLVDGAVSRDPLDSLPRLDADETRAAVGEIRNPAVTRSLTELRKVVNAIIRQHGKPAQIRIELARDLKRSKKERQKLSDRNRDNEEAREKVKKKILEEAGLASPSGTDIRKALLHEECNGICPYTGNPIPFRSLFGQESQFDIEHIIPFDRCFDNSFANLTLCESQESHHVKGKKTPWEAYHGDPAKYEEILDRVKRFHSPSAGARCISIPLRTCALTRRVGARRAAWGRFTCPARRLAPLLKFEMTLTRHSTR
jgi:CRISPR-associated endonuclease Csn1